MVKVGKKWIVGMCIAALTLVIGEIGAPKATAAGTEYYVATTGSDSNAGTSGEPWKTLQHAADVAVPGSTFYVRGGLYNQKLKITRSGSAAQGSITFSNYASETAIIDGTGLSVSGTEGIIDLTDANYITIQGFEIRNYTRQRAA